MANSSDKSKPKTDSKTDSPVAMTIDPQELDDHIEMLKPALKAHGGSIELVGVDDGVVLVKLTGACAGCSMVKLTLKEGVEKFLVKRVKGVAEVRAEGIE